MNISVIPTKSGNPNKYEMYTPTIIETITIWQAIPTMNGTLFLLHSFQATYAAMITKLDTYMGDLLKHLNKLEISENLLALALTF